MSEYEAMAEREIKTTSNELLKYKLREAQAEIERLNEKGKLCTPAEHERMIDQRVIKDLSARIDATNDMRSRATRLLSNRIDALEAPPKGPRLTLEEHERQVKAKVVEAELQEARWHDWCERVRALEGQVEELKTDCVPGSIWGHDMNEMSSQRGAAQFREAHETKVLERICALEELTAPPKDLSDPYPKDGPNVRNANAHDMLSKWLEDVEKRLRMVEGGDPTSTCPRWKNVCLGLSERLDELELEDPVTQMEMSDLRLRTTSLERGNFDKRIDELSLCLQMVGHVDTEKNESGECRKCVERDINLSTLNTRLTALSETVAKNRKHHDALTEQVTDNAKQPNRRKKERRFQGGYIRRRGTVERRRDMWVNDRRHHPSGRRTGGRERRQP